MSSRRYTDNTDNTDGERFTLETTETGNRQKNWYGQSLIPLTFSLRFKYTNLSSRSISDENYFTIF